MKNFKLVFILLASALFVSSCTDTKDANIWVVGTSADNPPYEQMKSGQIEGFDIDLIEAIGRHLGKDIQFKNMEFHGLLAALTHSNVDMVLAGMSITPERQARVDFSIPYTGSQVTVLFRKEDDVTQMKDFSGKIVGAQLGTIWSLIASDLAGECDFKVKALANNLMLIEELKLKRLDAVVIEQYQAAKFIEQHPQFASFELDKYSSSFAIALPKNSPHKKNINHNIKSLRNNGIIEALEKKWGIIGAN
ncbi:MAG: transporter substrate-binding domain-containing protein [Rickettsiaceae bacterium]